MLSKNDSKFVKSLKLKKYRQQERCFLVEGEKNIEEVLPSSLRVRFLVGTTDYIQRLQSRDVVLPTYYEVKQNQLESLGSFKSNQAGLAVVEMPKETVYAPLDDYVLVLDQVSDPGNLGTIVRTMDWFGFRSLVCSPDSADFYNPKTIAATMGSFTRIVPSYADLSAFLKEQKKTGTPVYGLVLGGDILTKSTLGPGIYVMGSEAHGISPEVMDLLDHRCTIRGHGNAESLNVAIATAVLLHEIRRP